MTRTNPVAFSLIFTVISAVFLPATIFSIEIVKLESYGSVPSITLLSSPLLIAPLPSASDEETSLFSITLFLEVDKSIAYSESDLIVLLIILHALAAEVNATAPEILLLATVMFDESMETSPVIFTLLI